MMFMLWYGVIVYDGYTSLCLIVLTTIERLFDLTHTGP